MNIQSKIVPGVEETQVSEHQEVSQVNLGVLFVTL